MFWFCGLDYFISAGLREFREGRRGFWLDQILLGLVLEGLDLVRRMREEDASHVSGIERRQNDEMGNIA